MRLTSVIHNNSIIPLSLKLLPSKYTSTVQFSHPRLPSFNSVISKRRGQNSPISCARGTEQEDDLSASEALKTSSRTRDDADKFIASSAPSSVDKSEEKVKGNYKTSIKTVALCVCTAVAFGFGIGLKDGVGKASEFFAGYILEQSLSVDNLFVFVLVFKIRVLSYGIAGAIIFRLSLILLGTATLQRFEAVNLFLAAILLYSSFKLFATEEDDNDLSDNFIVKTCQKFIPVTSNYDGNKFITREDGLWKATPLLLTVAVIELSDIAFAVDSIPAVFGVTRDPFIVFSSNLFAILGLRSLYTLISEGMADLEYLQPSIAIVLGFIGCKMILDFMGFHISTEASLGFVATSLGAGVLLSLMKKSD
ncbi:hypothetical protein OIU77_030667 [Salix suchowensis]|uniref:Thylakoid membrane protein TERC, chloroplastic n=1 Tax=Salix suchowensis TaxID=1278906 RepID=A0ABQ9BCR9_9ROSI|nr:hypothetical protein OIU77_030667 [Salix suchowensis]